MARNPHSLAKIFSPRLMEAAFKTFDKATLAVVVGAWTMAFFIIVFTLYTLHLSTSVQRDLTAAEAMEPLLPRIEKKAPDPDEIQALGEKLQKRFPEVKFSTGRDGGMEITASNSAHFRLWLNVLSYVDTISPEYRWTLQSFCVGMKCQGSGGGKDPMRAILSPQKVIFALPAAKKTTEERKKRKPSSR